MIAVEAARRLIADGAKPGVLTPAQAFDPAGFLDFLTARGLRWSIGTTDEISVAARPATLLGWSGDQ